MDSEHSDKIKPDNPGNLKEPAESKNQGLRSEK